QFRLLLGSKRQLGLALRACETLPQRHGDLDPFAGGELEELSEGVWLHTAIFPCHNPRDKMVADGELAHARSPPNEAAVLGERAELLRRVHEEVEGDGRSAATPPR